MGKINDNLSTKLLPAIAEEREKIMQKLRLGLMLVAIAAGFSETSSFAQMGGMGGMGGSNMSRPKRKLRKSAAPALSPALNMLPGAVTSFEGQFLLRQLPQEQALKQYQQTGNKLEQTGNKLDALQQEVTQTENQIRSGVKSTGHRTQFLNTGGYFGGSRGRGR